MKLLKGKRADQKELVYTLKKKTKKEQDKERDYITLYIMKKNEKEHDYNIMQTKIMLFKLILFFKLYLFEFPLTNDKKKYIYIYIYIRRLTNLC